MTLSKDQLAHFEDRLRSRRQTLTGEIDDRTGRVRDRTFSELAGAAPDAGDASVADLMTDLDNAEISRDLDELRDLDDALTRVADGSYGDCIDCGGEISPQRLEAVPTAHRCIGCQSIHEKTHQHPDRPQL